MDETDLTTARARARVGTLLNGRWHLDELVGMGGMAAVYAATHRNGKRVAIKILHPEISVDDNARQRFLREGYAANQVGHRGAVTADDDGTTEDGVAFLVMELLEGETLEERSARHGGRLSAREVLALMDQVLATLVAAHEQGIVHRDLKPENLFLTRDGVVKVLDFGIARMQDKSGASPSQTQGIMGTPSFMAPEQARGRWQDVDARTDLWAIGACMFTLLSGRVVHQAETANEALVLAVTQRAPAVAEFVANIRPELAALVNKALGYERELRFQTASEFREALHVAHATISGDESVPSLRVPIASAVSLLQPNPLRLTTGGGVAASVSTSPTTRVERPKRVWRAPLVLATLTGVLLLAIIGRGLLGVSKTALPSAQETLAASPAPPAAPRQAVVGTSALPALPRASVALVPDAAAPPPVPRPSFSVSRPSAARPPVSVGPKPSAAPKKTTSDPFKKRH